MSTDHLSATSGLSVTAPSVNTTNKPAQNPIEEKTPSQGLPANAAEARLQANKSLLDTVFGGAQGDAKAQRILYQEAVVQLESILKEALGDDNFSLEKLAKETSGVEGQEDYWSPEKTADRIVTGAMGFFETFKKQNPNLSEAEQVEKFMSIIAPAIDKGVGEATKILEGFGVFDGSIKENALKTQELVHEKLDAARQRLLGNDKADAELITSEPAAKS